MTGTSDIQSSMDASSKLQATLEERRDEMFRRISMQHFGKAFTLRDFQRFVGEWQVHEGRLLPNPFDPTNSVGVAREEAVRASAGGLRGLSPATPLHEEGLPRQSAAGLRAGRDAHRARRLFHAHRHEPSGLHQRHSAGTWSRGTSAASRRFKATSRPSPCADSGTGHPSSCTTGSRGRCARSWPFRATRRCAASSTSRSWEGCPRGWDARKSGST